MPGFLLTFSRLFQYFWCSHLLIRWSFHIKLWVKNFISMSEKPFSLEYYSSTNSWSKFPFVGSDSSFKPFGISFPAKQRTKKSLCDSHLVTLLSRRLNFNAICSMFLLVASVCCSEDVFWFVPSLTSVHVEACSTKMVGVCSSRFLFEILLLVSSPCLDLLLKKLSIGCF